MGLTFVPIVSHSGSLSAKLAVIGARPGKDELATGIPFSGYSGRLLWHLLPLPRDECYVDNVRQDFSLEHSVPTNAEIIEILPDLKQRLERLDANCFLVLGSQALFALTGKDSIDKYRGSILESTLLPGKKVVATWHPAHILRGQYERRYILEADLRKAVAQSTYPQINRRDYKFLINPGFEESREYIKNLGEVVSIDIECPISTPRIVYCLGLSDYPTRACCLPFTWGRLTARELAELWRIIQCEVFERRKVVGQNVGFDVGKLEAIGFQVRQVIFDTMLAHHLLWPEAGTKQKDEQGKDGFAGGHDLGFLVSCYTNQPYYKDLYRRKGWATPEDRDMQWYCNCLDACLTYDVYEQELEELKEFGQLDYFNECIMGLLRPIMRMQNRGLKVDFSRLTRVQERIALETKYLQHRLNTRVGFDINVKSPPQIRYLIENVLGLRSIKRTAKGAPSTDEDTLRNLAYGANEHADVFSDILEVRKRRTLVSGFLQLEADTDGRYKAPYKIHGTDSGRLASTSPQGLDGRKGPQLQNIPRSARVLFISEPGHVLILRDLRRAEAMFVAYDAQEERLINVFEDPSRDFYIEFAESTLGTQVGKKSIERECFKSVVHAANYGMGPKRYIVVLRLKGINIEDISVRGITGPQKKAEFFLEGYHQMCPRIREWQKEIIERGTRDRVLHDVFGRRRFFMGDLRDPHTHRVMLSYRPQASITGITNRGIRILDSNGYCVVLQVHDSLGVEVPFEDFDRAWEDTEKALHYPITLHGRTFVIPCDGAWGFSWGELNESRILATELPTLYREARGS